MTLEDWQISQAMNVVQQSLNNFMDDVDWAGDISTLWVNDRAYNRIPVFIIVETKSEIFFSAIIPSVVADSLEVQVTEEVIFISGEQLTSNTNDDYFDLEFGCNQFQSIIPLPLLIQPHAAIASLKNDTLTLVLQKSPRSRRQVKVKILKSQETILE